MRESVVEKALVKRVKELGGIAEKFTSPNKVGVPDRLCLFPEGKLCFVECKAPGERVTALQNYDHEIRRKLGFAVYVIDSIEAAEAFNHGGIRR